LQQLVELQSLYGKFQLRHAEIVALAVQDVQKARRMSVAVTAGFPILADVDHAAADAFGVFNLLGDSIAAPAVFVIDPSGSIVWSHIGQNAADSPSATDILSHLP
jgi:peroxiredoxin